MNRSKVPLFDDSEESAVAPASLAQKKEILSGGAPITISGDALAGDRETTYLERKALSAAGQWGRVKEMPNGCWEWQGAHCADGYGSISINGKSHRVHRLMAEIFNGPLSRSDLACHSCGNRRCCNPRHVVAGDYTDNNHDTIEQSGKPRPTRKRRAL